MIALSQSGVAQTLSAQEEDYANCFQELKAAEDQNVDLWGRDMYGPVLLVNPKTREVYSNFPDAGGALSWDGAAYSGRLPVDINIFNTKVHWNGREWAMVMLPLPGNKEDRINLLAHELFHVAQPYLGFRGYSPDNNQLDEKEGRICLRLELEALRQALEAASLGDMKKHVTDALIFREYRYILYPGAKMTENLLELNEGMAEYTGAMIADRTGNEAIYHFERSINEFVRFPTFVRSFAYVTTPIYGYLLRSVDKYWNKEISDGTNLTDFFILSFGITLPPDLQDVAHSNEDRYGGSVIRAEETTRETIIENQVVKYRSEFIEKPHLEILFEKMKLAFDPISLVPLDDRGTVYPNIRITDNWGILTVENGALMSPRWDNIIVSAPTKIDGTNVAGDGWTLQLNDGYVVVEDNLTGNYKLVRQY
ncbi:MAG: hypothetical protein ACLP05_13760 [Candidatus Kryptoniota bacterium]